MTSCKKSWRVPRLTCSNQHTYSFKAQHKPLNTAKKSTFFPVNSISFYNQDVFLTTGSDGVINIWDRARKTNVNTLQPVTANVTTSVARFLCKGAVLAFAVGYDWFQGVSGTQSSPMSVPFVKIVDEPLVKSS